MTVPAAPVVPIACPFGTHGTHTFSYLIATPVAVLIDCGHHASPAEIIAPAAEAHGVPVRSIRKVFATHGHFDHVGGAGALMDMLEDAEFAIHDADTAFLHSVAHHRATYSGFAYRWQEDPAAERALVDTLTANLVPAGFRAVPVADGDVADLGGGATLTAIHSPGHTAGSTCYRLDPWGIVFTGDAVQVHGGSGQRFPLITDPLAYRRTLDRLLTAGAAELMLGHRTLAEDRSSVLEARLAGDDVAGALAMSARIEAVVSAAAEAVAAMPGAAGWDDLAWLAHAAGELGYPAEPAGWPTSFASTLLAYRAITDAG